MPGSFSQGKCQDRWQQRRPNKAELMNTTQSAVRRNSDLPSTNASTAQKKPATVSSRASGQSTHLGPGCRFETTFVNKERRFSFYDVDKRLKVDPDVIQIATLDKAVESELQAEIMDTHQQLLPGITHIVRKEQFLAKLESLLNQQWPGKEFTVHAFGSTENKLGTRWSDVDVCIETEWTEFERQTCQLSKFMHQVGMQQVECRSQAKVPVVSVYDPELDVKCDMNINNTLALRNTKLVHTYMQIDERAKILTHVIKHWAKMRALNDAVCNTLTSYTWTLIVINFLQTRSPPILPCLHAWPHERIPFINGIDVSFADDVEKYGLRGFGSGNTESVASLLVGFFHHYTYVFDYESHVISVRQGRHVPKYMKNYPSDNILAIEEPFTTSRNLGNTADMGSFRGIHEELQRAHTLLVTRHSLDRVCEKYEPTRLNARQVSQRVSRQPVKPVKPRGPRSIRQTTNETANDMSACPTGLYQPFPLYADLRSGPHSYGSQTTHASSEYHLSEGCASEHLQYLNLATYPSSYPYSTISARCQTIAETRQQQSEAGSNRTWSQRSSRPFPGLENDIQVPLRPEYQYEQSRGGSVFGAESQSLSSSFFKGVTPYGDHDAQAKLPTAQSNRTYAHVCRTINSHKHATIANSDAHAMHEFLSNMSDMQHDFSGSDFDESQASCSLTLASSRSSPVSAAGYPGLEAGVTSPNDFQATQSRADCLGLDLDKFSLAEALEVKTPVVLSSIEADRTSNAQQSSSVTERETYASKVYNKTRS